MLQFLGIIPARYASTRFPGKPLVMINGKTMIERVVNQASKALEHVVVATDDDRIAAEVKRFGGKVIMTSAKHQSGTDRCAEAFEKYENLTGLKFDVAINIQGDEPLIQPLQFEKLKNCFDKEDTDIATLVKSMDDSSDIDNPNHVKVVLSKNKRALYFSRSPIPYLRHFSKQDWSENHTFYKHIGIYAYRSNVLKEITKLSPSKLEIAESLEQLRWLENDYNIFVEITEFDSISVDTPADLEKIIALKIQDN
jgi:3-deoxy-manno-octulosonate cytidylyltransferase (CMP-KDO synthetase)